MSDEFSGIEILSTGEIISDNLSFAKILISDEVLINKVLSSFKFPVATMNVKIAKNC